MTEEVRLDTDNLEATRTKVVELAGEWHLRVRRSMSRRAAERAVPDGIPTAEQFVLRGRSRRPRAADRRVRGRRPGPAAGLADSPVAGVHHRPARPRDGDTGSGAARPDVRTDQWFVRDLSQGGLTRLEENVRAKSSAGQVGAGGSAVDQKEWDAKGCHWQRGRGQPECTRRRRSCPTLRAPPPLLPGQPAAPLAESPAAPAPLRLTTAPAATVLAKGRDAEMADNSLALAKEAQNKAIVTDSGFSRPNSRK